MAGPGAQRSVGKVSVRVVPDTDGFRQQLRADLEAATAGMKIKIPVELDHDRMGQQIYTIHRRLTKETIKTTSSFNNLARSGNGVRRTFLGIGRAGWIAIGVFSAAPPVLGAVSGLLIGIPPLLGAIGAAAGAVALGWDGIKNAFSDLGDEVDDLQKSVSATFEKSLTPAVDNLEGLLPKLEGGLNKVAESASAMFESFTDVVSSDKGVAQLNTLLNNTADLLQGLRPMVRNFTDAFLTLGSEGSKHFGMLQDMLNSWSADFNEMIQRMSNNGTLEKALKGTTEVVESLLMLFNDLLEEGGKIIGEIGPEMSDFIDTFGDSLKDILPSLTRLVEQALPVFENILEAVSPLISTAADALAGLLEAFNSLPDPIKSVVTELAAMALALGAIKKAGRGIGSIGAAFTGFFGGGKRRRKNARNAGRRDGRAYTRGAGKSMEDGSIKQGSKFIRGLKKVPFAGTGIWAASELADAFGWTFTDKLTGQELGLAEAMGAGFVRGGQAITDVASDAAESVANIGKAAQNGGKLAVEGLASVDLQLLALTEHFREIGHPQPFIAASEHMDSLETNWVESARNMMSSTRNVGRVGAGMADQWEQSHIRVGAATRTWWDSARSFINQTTSGIQGTVDSVGAGVASSWSNSQQKVRDDSNTFWSSAKNFINSNAIDARDTVQGVGAGLATSWGTSQSNARNQTRNAWNSIETFINSKSNGIRGKVSSVGSGVANNWGRGQNRAKNLTRRAWNALSGIIGTKAGEAESKARSGASGIRGEFGFSLNSQGSAIMSSLMSGMQSMLPSVIGFAAGIAGQIAAVKGPLSYDRRLLIPAGKAIMEGLYEGLSKNFGSIIRLVSAMAPQLAEGFAGSNVGARWAEDVKNGFPDEVTSTLGSAGTSRWESHVTSDQFGNAQDAVFNGVMRAFDGSNLFIDGPGVAKLVNKQNTMKDRRK